MLQSARITFSTQMEGQKLYDRVGEIIESSSTEFIAQCYRLHEPPTLASLVKAGDANHQILAVVSNASTLSIQPGRRPVARGKGDLSEEQMYAKHPQIGQLLRTLITCQIVGYKSGASGIRSTQGSEVYQRLPPRPPKVHAFVYQCDIDEQIAFVNSLDFLNILIRSQAPAVDELITACLRQLSEVFDEPRTFLVRAGKELSVLLSGDPQRLGYVLGGLSI